MFAGAVTAQQSRPTRMLPIAPGNRPRVVTYPWNMLERDEAWNWTWSPSSRLLLRAGVLGSSLGKPQHLRPLPGHSSELLPEGRWEAAGGRGCSAGEGLQVAGAL